MPVFLDTNVFIYAAGTDARMRAECKAVLDAVAERRLQANTSAEVVQEVLHVLSRRGRRADALVIARSIFELFPELLAVGRREMELAASLLATHGDASVRDAVHVATAVANGILVIVSVDADLDAFPEIQRWTPAAFFKG